MIIEQVRYYVEGDDLLAQAVDARRAVDGVREGLGLPPGHILVADPPPDDGPAMVWQCGYENEHNLAVAEAAIGSSAEYASARDVLGGFVTRIEIELYSTDEDAS